MAGTYSTTIEIGADWNRTVVWKDGSNVAINLTGFTALCQLRDGQTLLATIATQINGPAGTITLSLSAAVTAALPAVTAQYDLFVTSSGGVKARLLAGSISILPRTSV